MLAAAPTLFSRIAEGAEKPSVPFNGGQSQIQSSFLETSGDYPFINLLKSCQYWLYTNGNAPVDPADLDTNGYPKRLPKGAIYTVFFVPAQASRRGDYVITWEGNATVYTGPMNAKPVSGSLAGSNGRGRYIFSTTDQRFVIGIASLNGSYISNLQVYHIADEPAVRAGDIFGKRFKALLQHAKPGVIRFLDWMNGNTTNLSTWETRRPVSYFSYFADEFRPNMYAGVTSHSGDDYSITFGSGGPSDKYTIQLAFGASSATNIKTATFTKGTADIGTGAAHGLSAGDPIAYANAVAQALPAVNYYVLAERLTSTTYQFATRPGGTPIVPNTSGSSAVFRLCTLNLNGTGRVPIRDSTGGPPRSDYNSSPIAGGYATLVYDASLASYLQFGATTGAPTVGLAGNVPIEVCVQLCKEVGAHPYFVAPMLACDPITDWVTELANYIKMNGANWMVPRFEGPNETWNSAGGFHATRYAWNKSAVSYGTYQQHDNWYGQVISQIGQSVAAVYGIDRTDVHSQNKYQILCGVWSARFKEAALFDDRLKSRAYIAKGGSAACNWVTHVCPTTYVNPNTQATNKELADAFTHQVIKAGDSAAQSAIIEAYVNDCDLADLKNSYLTWQAWGAGMPVPVTKLCSYEGGWSPDYAPNYETAYSTISGATRAASCVLMLANSHVLGYSQSGLAGNPAVVGMWVQISDVVGMTQLNGNTYQVTAVAGNLVTINVDSRAFGAYSSGGKALYFGDSAKTITSRNIINAYRHASKFAAAQKAVLLQNYKNFCSVPGGEFPSCYDMSAPSGVPPGNGGSVWGVFDPDIYANPSPQWLGIVEFNS